MNLEKILNYRLLGLIGSTLIIISQFLPWFSSQNLIEIYIITINVKIENAFLYLFPILSGIICFIANLLVYLRFDFKIKAFILNIVGIGFLIIFLFEFIPLNYQYILSNSGIYFYTIGFLLIIFNLINLVMDKSNGEI